MEFFQHKMKNVYTAPGLYASALVTPYAMIFLHGATSLELCFHTVSLLSQNSSIQPRMIMFIEGVVPPSVVVVLRL